MSSRHFWPPLTESADIPVAPPWHALETPATRWVKRVAAFVMAGALFLPLTRCQGKDAAGADWTTVGDWGMAVLVVLIFCWPLLYEGLAIVATSFASAFGHPWGRLALVGGSVVGLAWQALPALLWGGQLRYGIGVAVLALAAYGAMLVDVWRRRRRWQPG